MTLPIKLGSLVVLSNNKSRFGIVDNISDYDSIHIKWNVDSMSFWYRPYMIDSMVKSTVWTFVTDEKEILQYLLKHDITD